MGRRINLGAPVQGGTVETSELLDIVWLMANKVKVISVSENASLPVVVFDDANNKASDLLQQQDYQPASIAVQALRVALKL